MSRPFQRVSWTALPRGIDTGTPVVSVHIAPRLMTDDGSDTTLASFTEWIDWPATVRRVNWNVGFGSQQTRPATVVSPAPRSDLWTALFPRSTLVRSHNAEMFEKSQLLSYPV